MSDITGSWVMNEVGGNTYSMSINTTGSATDPLSGELLNGTFIATGGSCTIFGSISSRASKKNVFDVSATILPNPNCINPDALQSGIAVYMSANGSSTKELWIALQDQNRTFGTLLVGHR